MQIFINKTKTTTIALILTLTIAATLITAAPLAFGQLVKINTAAVMGCPFQQPWENIRGIGQTVLLQVWMYPAPGYIDVEFTIEAPNETRITEVATADRTGEAYIEFLPDALGEWRARASWEGDETHEDVTSTWEYFTVQTEPTADYTKTDTYSYVSSVPADKIGQGDAIYVVGWLTPPRELRSIFQDLTFTITKPDGTTETVVKDSDSPATASFGYICDQVGTYSVVLNHLGDRFHTASTSTPHTWISEADYVAPRPEQQPLPDYPWTHPVSAEFQEWYQITGAWPQSNYDAGRSMFNPYTKGPNTAHVLWKRTMTLVGMIGQQGYSALFGSGDSPVAAYGRLYYLDSSRNLDNQQIPVLVCLDQYTGEELFRANLPGSGSGGSLYIEISDRVKLDPKVGTSVAGVVSIWSIGGGGLREINPLDGSIRYFNGDLTRSGTYHEGAIYYTGYNGTSESSQSDCLTKWDTRLKEVQWTLSVPYGFRTFFWEDVFVTGDLTYGGVTGGEGAQQRIVTYNLTTGELIAAGGPGEGVYAAQSSARNIVADGKYFYWGIDMRLRAISIYTADEVWASDVVGVAPWGTFASYDEAAGYGLVYFKTWDGYIRGFSTDTGKLEWETYLDDNPDTAMGANVPWERCVVADGKLYVATGEHTAPTPAPRGNKLYCLDAFTGEKIWEMPLGMSGTRGISSGMLWSGNDYDGCLYMFGKGETATTVKASPKVAAKGTSVLIEGTVTDQSPGTPDTPAISDEDQSEWMQYLYYNKPMPTDAIGVTVFLQAMRSDGNVIDIWHCTTDIMGHYEYLWTPPDQDTYKVLATFEGSESYYMSSAQTALGVTAAPSQGNQIEPEPTTPEPTTPEPTTPEPTTPEPTTPEPTEAPLITTEIAIIAAIAVAVIIGVAAYWALKKQRK